MDMKLAYERPMMRAQVFQANAYVASCDRIAVLLGQAITATIGNAKYFFGTTAYTTRQNEWNANWTYYKGTKEGDTENDYFLMGSYGTFDIYQDLSTSGTGAYEENMDSFLGIPYPTGDAKNSGEGTLQAEGIGSYLAPNWSTSLWGEFNRSNPDVWWRHDKMVHEDQQESIFGSEDVFDFTAST